ncbi:MAG TPA: hypothetical protein VE974_15235 [Thermoanaerobaculia bacterium]|nr:hypothetical protein [Thermoanaerobaculia bacterium]
MQPAPFLGAWRQVRPDPAPAAVVVRFEPEGLLVYSMAGQHLELTWRVEADTLVVGDDQRSRYRFRSPTVLVLEREGERFVYYRVAE